MLTKLKITNFKNFDDTLIFDLSDAKSYAFNKECIKNKIINKAIIYGANGSGKSNLGLAIFDLVSHLTDKEIESKLYSNYLNAFKKDDKATFDYEFQFDDSHVQYIYTKKSPEILISEELRINGELFASVNKEESSKITINIKGAETLNREMGESKISILSYIHNNTILEDNLQNKSFNKFMDFVSRMLFFRSLHTNTYIGLEQGTHTIDEDIINQKHVEEFEAFLNDAGIKCKLDTRDVNNKKQMVFDFGTQQIPFFEIASSGTTSLALFYFWFQRLKENKVSLVFVDEFDAFYHQKLSALIVEKLKEINAQVILTTHNTSIMSTEILRPDCYFILDENEIKSIPNCTEKELREAHNLEKMYKAGAFA